MATSVSASATTLTKTPASPIASPTTSITP